MARDGERDKERERELEREDNDQELRERVLHKLNDTRLIVKVQ